MNRSSQLVALASCAFLLVPGCTAHYAQSPEEWVHYHKQGTLLRGTKAVDVARSRKAVETNLAEYLAKCVDGMVTVSRLQQGMQLQVSKTQYAAKLKPSADGKTVLAIQTKDLTGPNLVKGQHPDGDFFLVSEIQPDGTSTTKITSYYVTTSAPFAEEILEWANGVKNKCPKTR